MRKLYKENEANYTALATDKLFADYENEFEFTGITHDMAKFIERDQLLRSDLWNRFVEQFREEDADYEAGWRGEYWGKMMRGASFVYSYTKNEELYAQLEKTVLDIMTTADEDGRISSYARHHEFDGWDIWSRKYVLLGMQYFLEICKSEELKDKIIASMRAQADYIISKIGLGEGKKHITTATRHWRGLNSASLLEPIVRLYTLTSDKKYFDFATYIVDSGATDIVNVFDLAYENKLELHQYPVTKAYEMTSCFEGLLEYYRHTKCEKYKTAIVNFANKILKNEFTVIGSAGCTHELFDHSVTRQANTTNNPYNQETCVTVTLMKFFYQLSRLTGDSKFADAFEIAYYNAYLGAINTAHSLEESNAELMPGAIEEPVTFDAYSPLVARKRGIRVGGYRVMSDKHYYGCCACIGSAGIGLVPKMALLTSERGFAYNLFIDGKIKSKTPGGQDITFTTATEYPKNSKVKITISLDKPENFEILIRNPEWNKETELKVNGEPVQICEGYIPLEREWKCGDIIEFELDLRARVKLPIPYGAQVLMNEVIWGKNYMIPTYDEEDPLAKNHIAIVRGPITLAQEGRLGADMSRPAKIVYGDDGFVDAKLAEGKDSVAPYENILEVTVPTECGEMHLTDYASAGKPWNDEAKVAAWILNK